MNNGLELLPVKVRRALYIGYGCLIIIVGGIDAWYGEVDPAWYEPLRRVTVYLGIPFAGLAALNARAANSVNNPRDDPDYVPERALNDDEEGVGG